MKYNFSNLKLFSLCIEAPLCFTGRCLTPETPRWLGPLVRGSERFISERSLEQYNGTQL